jgi:TonB family protein
VKTLRTSLLPGRCSTIFTLTLVGALLSQSNHSWAAPASDDSAASDDAAAKPSPKLVPPTPLDISVAYPAEARGNASVSLSFVVAVDGTVRDPEVDVGDEPFASAAIAASKNWRFTPATLGEAKVAVRIAMEVRFSEQTQAPKEQAAPAVEPGEDEQTEAKPEPKVADGGSAVATVEASADVTVEGQRPPGAISFSRAEARQMPGAFGDPLRAVDSMPGVTPLVSGLPVFYLRGAPPGNTGYFVDEIRLPFLFHAFLGPSVINPELVERVNLYSSWYPANHGGLAGGVVEAELRAPRGERTYSFGLGLWEAGAFMESPFAGEQGNIFLGGRYAFTGLLLSAFTPNTIEYWNYQALAEYKFGSKNTGRVFLLGAFDYFEDPDQQFLGTEFHRIDLRLDHRFSSKTLAYAGVTLGIDRTRFSQARVTDKSIAARLRLHHQASPEALLRVGANVGVDSFDLALNASERLDNYIAIQELFPARDDLVFGVFTDMMWRPRPSITVTPGVRADLYRSAADTAVGVDPQVSARFQLNPSLAAIHTVGLTHQPPNYVPSIPGVRVAGLEGGLQKSIHASSGVEVPLPADITGTFSVFDNVYLDLTDPYALTQNFGLNTGAATQRLLGHAYGLEVEFRRPLTRRLGAMLSYTLSRSTRSYDNVETLAGSDRTHVVNLAGMYTLGKNWRVGGRSVFYNGVPGREYGEAYFPHSRSAPFFRLDLRLERRFRLGPRSWWSLVAEALNVTASREALSRVCDLTCTDEVVGPVLLPNVKVEAQF